jgi:D-alanine-D-alanine ligase-like ATP-grasp enzyme
MLAARQAATHVGFPFLHTRRRLAARMFILRSVGLRHVVHKRRVRAFHARVGGRLDAEERMWLEAAAEVGAELHALAGGFFEFRRGDKVARVSHQTTPFTDAVSSALMSRKPLASRILTEAGLPLPEQLTLDASDRSAALAFLDRTPTPVVVKPARGGGGSGLVGHVCTPKQLSAALQKAGRYHDRVILERQVGGDSYRVTLLDGEVLDVLRRSRPQVVGDGVSTVAALMLREYERRVDAGGAFAGFKAFEVDHDTIFTLAYNSLSLDSVPREGQEVEVKTATNFSGPEQTQSVLRDVGADMITAARTAADALGARLAGVDVVTTNPQIALAESGGVILEVNTPGLLHHYNIAEPERASRVAIRILQTLLEDRP